MVTKIDDLKCNKKVIYSKVKSLDSFQKLQNAESCINDSTNIYDKVADFNKKFEIFEKVTLKAVKEKGACKKHLECTTLRKELDSLVNPIVDAVFKYHEKCMEEKFKKLLERTIDQAESYNRPNSDSDSDIEIECIVPESD